MLVACLVAAGAAAASAQARPPVGLVRVSPNIPIVGKRTTILLELPSAAVPSTAVLEVLSPTNVHMKLRLARVATHLMRTTYHFADDGLWTLRVRSPRVDAYGEILVFQNGALAPAPSALRVPRAGKVAGLADGGGVVALPVGG